MEAFHQQKVGPFITPDPRRGAGEHVGARVHADDASRRPYRALEKREGEPGFTTQVEDRLTGAKLQQLD